MKRAAVYVSVVYSGCLTNARPLVSRATQVS